MKNKLRIYIWAASAIVIAVLGIVTYNLNKNVANMREELNAWKASPVSKTVYALGINDADYKGFMNKYKDGKSIISIRGIGDVISVSCLEYDESGSNSNISVDCYEAGYQDCTDVKGLDDGEIIIPEQFKPKLYGKYDNGKSYIDGDTLIGTTITLRFYNIERSTDSVNTEENIQKTYFEKDYKVVGTYDSELARKSDTLLLVNQNEYYEDWCKVYSIKRSEIEDIYESTIYMTFIDNESAIEFYSNVKEEGFILGSQCDDQNYIKMNDDIANYKIVIMIMYVIIVLTIILNIVLCIIWRKKDRRV